MHFSLEQLAAFVAVYEKGSFSEAAVKLNKHRTTIGQVITNLEDQLAVELFERIGRSAKPTSEGQLLYSYAKVTIEQAKSFNKMALSLSYGQLECLNIAYTSLIPSDVLVSIRQLLLEKYPAMKVNFLIKTKEEVKAGIEDDSIQLGFVNVDQRTPITSFDITFLCYLTFGLYTAKNSPLAELPNDQIFGALKTSKQLILKAYLDDEISQKILLSSNYEVIEDFSLLLSLVQQGVGWSLLPRVTIEDLGDLLQLQKLNLNEVRDDFQFPIALWAPRSKAIMEIKKDVESLVVAYINERRAR
ncbi:LysR family transcriptional regulator [Agarivorans albus]|uniref:Transcriptional regulators n=1 Tax=Agarivorans albus MKT 106 TaxID=1331007 RepID=R9PL22_AGAAL|nr:LysR family transcriptional regulator [Agarivorans albus]GAD02067.1 transcriptional regulators [Agarivorans albus MKT 106]